MRIREDRLRLAERILEKAMKEIEELGVRLSVDGANYYEFEFYTIDDDCNQKVDKSEKTA